MSDDQKHIVTIQKVELSHLILYAQGKLTDREQHRVEKYVLENPFEADALEGLLQMKDSALVTAYSKKIQKAVSGTKTRSIYWWSIAASLLLFISLGYYYVFDLTVQNQSNNELVIADSSKQVNSEIEPTPDTGYVVAFEEVTVPTITAVPKKEIPKIAEVSSQEEQNTTLEEQDLVAIAEDVSPLVQADGFAEIVEFEEESITENISSEGAKIQEVILPDSLLQEMLAFVIFDDRAIVLDNFSAERVQPETVRKSEKKKKKVANANTRISKEAAENGIKDFNLLDQDRLEHVQYARIKNMIEAKYFDEALSKLATMDQEEEKTHWLQAITHFGKGEAEEGVKHLLHIIQADQDTPITQKAREILKKLK